LKAPLKSITAECVRFYTVLINLWLCVPLCIGRN